MISSVNGVQKEFDHRDFFQEDLLELL